MSIKTLGGMFCEPKKTTSRNFVKENITSVGNLQGLLKGVSSLARSNTSYDLISSRVNSIRSNDVISIKTYQNLKKAPSIKSVQSVKPVKKLKPKQSDKPKCNQKKNTKCTAPTQTYSDMCVQTQNDVIIDTKEKQNNEVQNKTVLKESNKNKLIESKEETAKEPINCDNKKDSKNHYKEAKEETPRDPSCPVGYRLLPESERKQTLRSLQQKYSEKIRELNSLSMRNDTLRIQQKKIQLEKELDKIDAGILTFDRPKVYLKDC